MQVFKRHTALLNYTTALLLFVGSSGFTAVIRVCTMGDSRCCTGSPMSDHEMCDPQLPPGDAGESVHGLFSCHENVIAGGLSSTQGLPEKESRVGDVKVPASVVFAVHLPQFEPTGSPFGSLWFDDTSPPSVKKYVLNGTFLI